MCLFITFFFLINNIYFGPKFELFIESDFLSMLLIYVVRKLTRRVFLHCSFPPQDLIDRPDGARAVFVSVGLPEPQLPADLFRDVDVNESAAAQERLGVFTSKWLLRRASGYAKRLPVGGAGGGCGGGGKGCGAGGCGASERAPSASAVPVPPDFRGKTVLVLGAGDTAMDCATAALRCGARRVRVVFRRGTPDVRAVPEELEGAMRERCELVPHSQPVRFLFRKGSDGATDRIRAVQFRRTDVDDVDGADAGDEDTADEDLFVLRADCVVSAFGSRLPSEGEFERSDLFLPTPPPNISLTGRERTHSMKYIIQVFILT